MVDFVDQGDGTRVEVKQRKVDLGDEVKNETEGRVYRVVSAAKMAAIDLTDCRSRGNTWL